ncbi:MAG: aminoglycoside phosphotransferase family protein [Chloroflexota bacterium]
MSTNKFPDSLLNILKHLDESPPTEKETWEGAIIEKIGGGRNNLIYRVQQEGHDVAVKFTIKDERDRARREYVALSALHAAGIDTTPQALWLDESSYQQPVVIQSWLDGQTLEGIPADRAGWSQLVDHFVTIHSVKKAAKFDQVPNAVLGFQNGAQGKQMVLEFAELLPRHARPSKVQDLLNWFANWAPPSFPQAQLALCRSDANWRNFIQQEHKLASVDWENSGWGDPAFEIADLMTHPAYEGVSQSDWDFVVKLYAERSEDPTAQVRIKTYTLQMLMWWVIRWARYLHEIPLGKDQRLAKRSDDWKPHTERKLGLEIARLEKAIEENF